MTNVHPEITVSDTKLQMLKIYLEKIIKTVVRQYVGETRTKGIKPLSSSSVW